MTSEATVMSKPDLTREAVGHAAQGRYNSRKRAVVHVQNRRQTTRRVSMSSSLPQ